MSTNKNRIVEEFFHAGRRCVIAMGGAWLGNYCGYVEAGGPVEEEHAIDVHGGVTWCENRLPWERNATGLWVGFDTCHAGDQIRNHKGETIKGFEGGVFRDLDYTRDETKRLAEQLAKRRQSVFKSREELVAWCSNLLRRASESDDDAATVADGLAREGHPAWGTDWSEYLSRHDVWLIAHSEWRLKQRRLDDKIKVVQHGRGVRLTDGDGLDVYCVTMEEVDDSIASWELRNR